MFYSSISIITERFHLVNICTNYQSVWKLSYVVKITSWLQASSHCTAHPTPSTLHYAWKHGVGRHSGRRETGADGLYSQEAAAGAGVRGLHVRGDHRHHGRQRPPRRVQQRSCGLRGTNLNLLFHWAILWIYLGYDICRSWCVQRMTWNVWSFFVLLEWVSTGKRIGASWWKVQKETRDL